MEFDTSDLLTTVTALGEQSDPWGPRHNLARTGLGDVYGRHEVVIDTDHGGEGDADEVRAELYDAAYEELSRRAGARLQVRAQFIDGHPNAPWTLGDVWMGDTATVELPSYFGGNRTMRCTEFSVSLEPAGQDDRERPARVSRSWSTSSTPWSRTSPKARCLREHDRGPRRTAVHDYSDVPDKVYRRRVGEGPA